MKLINLYMETSVFGFCFDQEEHNREKRSATLTLFDQVRQGRFRGYISDVVQRELRETRDERLRHEFLELAKPFEVLALQPLDDIAYLSRLYVDRGAVPVSMIDDALHVAHVAANPKIDVLVSWNFRHIVNINVKRRLKTITEEAGYKFAFDIATPAEVIYYEI